MAKLKFTRDGLATLENGHYVTVLRVDAGPGYEWKATCSRQGVPECSGRTRAAAIAALESELVKQDLLPLSLDEIAERLYVHLRRMSLDPKINIRDPRYRTCTFYQPNAHRSGARIAVRNITYQCETLLSREDALAYLRWLDAGNNGTNYTWERAQKQATAGPAAPTGAAV